MRYATVILLAVVLVGCDPAGPDEPEWAGRYDAVNADGASIPGVAGCAYIKAAHLIFNADSTYEDSRTDVWDQDTGTEDILIKRGTLVFIAPEIALLDNGEVNLDTAYLDLDNGTVRRDWYLCEPVTFVYQK